MGARLKVILDFLLYSAVLGAASGENAVTLVDGVPWWVAASDEVGLEAMATRLLADIANLALNLCQHVVRVVKMSLLDERRP